MFYGQNFFLLLTIFICITAFHFVPCGPSFPLPAVLLISFQNRIKFEKSQCEEKDYINTGKCGKLDMEKNMGIIRACLNFGKH